MWKWSTTDGNIIGLKYLILNLQRPPVLHNHTISTSFFPKYHPLDVPLHFGFWKDFLYSWHSYKTEMINTSWRSHRLFSVSNYKVFQLHLVLMKGAIPYVLKKIMFWRLIMISPPHIGKKHHYNFQQHQQNIHIK